MNDTASLVIADVDMSWRRAGREEGEWFVVIALQQKDEFESFRPKNILYLELFIVAPSDNSKSKSSSQHIKKNRFGRNNSRSHGAPQHNPRQLFTFSRKKVPKAQAYRRDTTSVQSGIATAKTDSSSPE